MSQDTLSDVLRGVRLRGAVFFNVSASGQWAAEAPAARELAPMMMRGVDHVIEYHAVARGTCWAGLLNVPPVQLFAGDVVMFPHGDAHVVSSEPGMRGNPDFGWFANTRVDQLPLRLALGGDSVLHSAPPDGHAETNFVCGFLGCDVQPFNPLIAALPRLLLLRANDDNAWIANFTQQAVAESHAQRPGGEAMLARMSEMMFVDAVRRYCDQLPPQSEGWLASRLARPLRRPRLGADARAAGAALDHRRARALRRPVTFHAARALRRVDRYSADAVPGAVAHAGRGAAAARNARHGRVDCSRRRV